MVCLEMGWTEQEYCSQPWEFIQDILTYLTETNKENAKLRAKGHN